MKRSNIVMLVVVAVVAVVLAGTAVAAPAREQGPMLAGTLEVAQVQFAPAEPIAVTFRLENLSDASVWVLRWQTPTDEIEADLFEVRRDGEAVPYAGMLAKRAAPVAEDYVEIRAGEALTAVFDPSAAYDMTARGAYAIRYRVRLLALRTEPPVAGDGGLRAHAAARPMATSRMIESNVAVFSFEGLEQQAGFVAEPESISGYSKCTTSQQSSMQTAHNNAITITNKGKADLVAYPNGNARYTYWFGTWTSSRFSTVKTHYNAINDAFVNKGVVYDCGCKKNYYAYVYPNQPYKIYVCRVFWAAPELGRDSRAGTLVHEMSHFYVTASTDDWVYGATGAHNLAVSNPDQAIDNADNHEYFCEDQP